MLDVFAKCFSGTLGVVCALLFVSVVIPTLICVAWIVGLMVIAWSVSQRGELDTTASSVVKENIHGNLDSAPARPVSPKPEREPLKNGVDLVSSASSQATNQVAEPAVKQLPAHREKSAAELEIEAVQSAVQKVMAAEEKAKRAQ